MKRQRVGRNRFIAPIHAQRFGRRNKAIAPYALTRRRKQTPSEILLREGRKER